MSKLTCLGLILLVIITYGNSVHGAFVFDDKALISENVGMIGVHNARDILKFSGFRSLLMMSFATNYYFSGLNPTSYHVVNITLHAINVLLVYWILLLMVPVLDKNREFMAGCGAAVFAVHTLFTSAVAYIAGRSSVLCGTFYFLAIVLFLKAIINGGEVRASLPRRGGLASIYTVLLLLGSVASGYVAWNIKQEAITLPAFLAVYVAIKYQKWLLAAVLGLVPVAAVMVMWPQLMALYVVTSTNQDLAKSGFAAPLPQAQYIWTYVTGVVTYYLPRFLWPGSLNPDPYIETVAVWYSPWFIMAVLVLAAMGWWMLTTRNRMIATGIAALLVSPLMAYSVFPLADIILEHRAYIPGLGVAVLAAAFFKWVRCNDYTWRWGVLGVFLVILMGMSVNQNTVWATNESVWVTAEHLSPEKVRGHFNLAQEYQSRGPQWWPQALKEYEHTIKLSPKLSAAHSNMAAIYIDYGQLSRAESELLTVTTISPEFPEGFINLGVLYMREGLFTQSEAALRRVIELSPDSYAGHFNLGETLTHMGKFHDAIPEYKLAAELRPDLPALRYALGLSYYRVNMWSSSRQEMVKLASTPYSKQAEAALKVLDGIKIN